MCSCIRMAFNTKILKIDSSKATTYFNAQHTAFTFQLENPISVKSSEAIVYSLTNAYIPFSFYGLNANNCYLDVHETVSGVSATRTIAIPFGNYSAYDFAKLLTTLLNGNTISYNITYNKNNNTFTINTTASTMTAVFLFQTGQNASSSCHVFVGLPALDTIINVVPFQTNCITMNDVYYFQIKTDIGSSENFLTSDYSDGVLDIIPIGNQPLHFISYNPFNAPKFLLMNSSLTNVKIALTDNKGRPVDLNGIPFLLTIRIDIIEAETALIPVGTGRDTDKTPLQFFMEKPEMVNKPIDQTPINLAELTEYRLIQKMLKRVKRGSK